MTMLLQWLRETEQPNYLARQRLTSRNGQTIMQFRPNSIVPSSILALQQWQIPRRRNPIAWRTLPAISATITAPVSDFSD
jgi:hypothetical protein